MNDIRSARALEEARNTPRIVDEPQARLLVRRNLRGVREGFLPSAGLSAPHALDAATVEAIVTRKAPGVYALGRSEGDTFYIRCIGRSDHDVAARLREHLGDYPQFKFAYFGSAKAAFEKECNLYHDFGESKLDNRFHPARPAFSGWECPRCRLLDY